MARKRKKQKVEKAEEVSKVSDTTDWNLPKDPEEIEDEKFLLNNGWVFLKEKGDKKVFVKNRVRKQISK